MTRDFSTAHILNITTGRLFTDIEGVYQILDFMLGKNHLTQELPVAARVCAPILRSQFPWTMNVPHIDSRLRVVEPDKRQAVMDDIAMEISKVHNSTHSVKAVK